ncbi:MAG: phosphatidate cytidylyltransferase [Oscillospiraceae bacterium]|nr:phosphatidate cytidylyltransferase [Oscillospiraceae bacterium]
MKTRVITAAVLVPVLLVIVLAAPKIVTAIVWGALLAIAAYELLYRTELVRNARLVIYSAVMAFAITMWSYLGAEHAWGQLGLMLFTMLLFAEMMMSHVKVTFDKICMCMVAGVLVPFLLSSLIRIHTMKIGKFMILIPFIVAFASDAGAYFAGRFFGAHKLAPVISPHKTVEGAAGGVICAVVCMVLYTVVLQLAFDFYVNYLYAILYGLLGSLVGIVGDLCFSVIKRQTGIKDYGNLIPGHGGVLDRFDSMMMVGPLMEVLILLIPVAV